MMKYYDSLLEMTLFSKQQVNQLVGNADTAKTLLKSYLQHGYIEKIRHNYYAVKSLDTKQPVPDRFAIASNINEKTYISHHAAFEYYGMTNQVFTEIQVSTSKPFMNFDFDGVRYVCILCKMESGIVSPTSKIRITDIERTIVDNIKDFTKYGGLEELLRCLSLVTFTDEEKLLVYLNLYDTQFLYQKAGFILSHYQKSMKLSEHFFTVCKKETGKSIRYLYDGIQHENPVFYPDWQIYAPADLLKLIDEGGEEIV